MAARPRFTRERLQRAALAIVDKGGLEALSMRSLAAALGTGAMTLYTYLRDREDLDALLVEAIVAEANWPKDERADWRDDVRAIAHEMWSMQRRHPNVIPLLLTRRVMHETTLEPAEAMLRALARGGRTGPALLAAFRAVSGYIAGTAQAQVAGVVGSGDAARDANIARSKTLPADRFPKLIEIATAAAKLGPEREFRTGLEVILAGLDKGRTDRRALQRGSRAKK